MDILITYFSLLDFTVPRSDISEKRFSLLWEPLRVDYSVIIIFKWILG